MAFPLLHILKNECPNCHKGKVFKDPYLLRIGFPKMNEHCPHCHFKFEKEPGYFFGAMYVNYGLTVFQGIATYFIARPFFDETFDLRIIPVIAGVILTLCFFNMRLSRLLWIYMLKNYTT